MDDKKFENYFKKYIEKFILTAEEERQYAINIYENKNYDLVKESTDKLIKATLKTVLSVAKKYINMGFSLGEMINEGYFGILDALKKYNPYYMPKTRFSTYAFFHIKNRILKVLNDKDINAKQSLEALKEISDFEEKFGLIDYHTPEELEIEKSNEKFLVNRIRELLTPDEADLAFSLIGFKHLNYVRRNQSEIAYSREISEQRIGQNLKVVRKKLIIGKLLNKKGQVIWM